MMFCAGILTGLTLALAADAAIKARARRRSQALLYGPRQMWGPLPSHVAVVDAWTDDSLREFTRGAEQ